MLCAVLLKKKICHKLRRTCGISTHLLKGKSDKLYDESRSSLIVSPKSLPSYFVFKLPSWRQSDILHGLLVQALTFSFFFFFLPTFTLMLSSSCCHMCWCAGAPDGSCHKSPTHTHAFPPPHDVTQ